METGLKATCNGLFRKANSKSEVLREGVRLVQDHGACLAALDTSIARGLADKETGRTTSLEEVAADMRRLFGPVKA